MKKIVLLLLFGVLFVGCGAKKKSYEFKSHEKFDSISFKQEKIIYPALRDTVYIENPCDSLTGKLKDFKQSFMSQVGKIIIEGRKGALTASIDLKESSTTTTEKDKTSKEKDVQIKEVEVVRYKTDWKLWIILAVSVLLNVYLLYRRFIK